MGDINWNPPPHNLTKPPRVSWQGYNMWDTGDWVTKSNGTTTYVSGRLGGIYTSDLVSGTSWGSGSTSLSTKKWGCRFHYNPTSISMGSSPNSSLSATSLDQGGVLLGAQGTSQVAFTLYFNRIYDMVGDPKDYAMPLSKTPENQAAMIKQLGTQYDIEYLYRAVNGDPTTDQRLSYKTADWGTLTVAPVNIDLGPFKWVGSITSISINHILFTPDMVPTFTTVDLSIQRQITWANAQTSSTTTTSSGTSTSSSSSTTTQPKNGSTAGQKKALAADGPSSTSSSSSSSSSSSTTTTNNGSAAGRKKALAADGVSTVYASSSSSTKTTTTKNGVLPDVTGLGFGTQFNGYGS